MDRPALGIIGLGWYFRYAYLDRLRPDTSPFRVTAVCRRNRAKLEADAAELQASAQYTSWQDLLQHVTLDAILISTPHDLHYKQVRAALECGLHVLVDKPLCLDAARAEELVHLAHRNDLVLSVAYNYNYWSHLRAARALIARGAIGSITSVACLGSASAKGSPILDPESWYHDTERAGGGSLISGGTHRIAAIFFLTGLYPRSLYAHMRGPSPMLDYQAGIVMDLGDGVPASLLNEAQGPEWRLEISIYGENGAVLIRNHQAYHVTHDGTSELLRTPKELDAIIDFHAAVVHGEPPVTSGAEAYWSVAVVQAAYESAVSQQRCAVRQFRTVHEAQSEEKNFDD